MAKAFLTSAHAEAREFLEELERAADVDIRGRHTRTDDPDEADLIVFVEAEWGWPFYERNRRHPLTRRHPEKSFLFTRVDNPLVVMQGVYTSLTRGGYHPQWTRSGVYLRASPWQPPEPPPSDPLLCSFMGNMRNHPVREQLFALAGPDVVIEDTSAMYPYTNFSPEEMAAFRARYAEVGRRSRFILAPRGKGTSSIRLFEALRMGRPPVIIADDWVEPEGPDWDAMSVRIAERDVARIPEILRAREPEAEALGRRAREAWERWFSEQTVFDTLVTWCLAIRDARRLPTPLLRGGTYAGSFRVAHGKKLARRLLRMPR